VVLGFYACGVVLGFCCFAAVLGIGSHAVGVILGIGFCQVVEQALLLGIDSC